MKKLFRTPELFGRGSGRLFECDGAPGEPPADSRQSESPITTPLAPATPTSFDIPKPQTLEDLEVGNGERAAVAAGVTHTILPVGSGWS